jgi:glutamate dehydrogenase
MHKFNPESPLPLEEVTKRAADLRASIRQNVEDTTTVVLLDKMLEAVEGTFRTNLYMRDRYSLALRIDPQMMMAPGENRVLPYGVFFVHGRRFNGFHVRFRDIARGGLRIVSPPMAEQIAIESARQFDEAYGLAYAQQLKNKDIPEGGSKAVVLVDTINVQAKSRDFAKRKAVKGFVDGLLDLIVETPETKANIVDYWGKREYLYLGPDEQIIPSDITWIVRQAHQRKYINPSTFMSSKPDAGINHKVYGVTSEGIAVFLAVGLRRLGLDPSQDDFTIKLTGGTDGDVAGNMIKILARDYGARARVVGLADGTAVVEDPTGLDMKELMRLVDGSLPLAQFNPAALSPQGQFHTVETEEGIRARNTMHNRVLADAFIPAGGRPSTIDGTNYRQFLQADGRTPSARLIVEGANIFITPEARKKLFEEAGVLIIKDSSANKCGVICSSFEIISSMLLSEREFKEHKEEIVGEVLEKLRHYARLEAELLFREFANYPGALPYFSERISNAINLARDAVTQALDGMTEEQYEELLPLFRDHLPRTVVELGFDHVREKVPGQYIKNAFGSCLASRIVYREGTHFIESQPRERLAELCLRYLEEEREVRRLLQRLDGGQLTVEETARVHKILDVGGVRSLLFAAS